jgi:hypothetical protein
MQIQQDQIKRPRLIEPFLHLELTSSNDYVDYINTTSADNNVTSLHNNSINISSTCAYLMPRFESTFSFHSESNFFKIQESMKQVIEDIYTTSTFSIFPQSRNGMSSLM